MLACSCGKMPRMRLKNAVLSKDMVYPTRRECSIECQHCGAFGVVQCGDVDMCSCSHWFKDQEANVTAFYEDAEKLIEKTVLLWNNLIKTGKFTDES